MEYKTTGKGEKPQEYGKWQIFCEFIYVESKQKLQKFCENVLKLSKIHKKYVKMAYILRSIKNEVNFTKLL